jgi:hypothetical protein
MPQFRNLDSVKINKEEKRICSNKNTLRKIRKTRVYSLDKVKMILSLED